MILKKIKDLFLHKGILKGRSRRHDEQDIPISQLLYAYTTEEDGPWNLWKGDNISLEIVRWSDIVKLKDNLYWRLDVGNGSGIMVHSIKDRHCNRYDAKTEYAKQQKTKTPKCISDEIYNLREPTRNLIKRRDEYLKEVYEYSGYKTYVFEYSEELIELYDYMGNGYIEPKSFAYHLDCTIAAKRNSSHISIIKEMRRWISSEIDMSKRLERESKQEVIQTLLFSSITDTRLIKEEEFMDLMRKGMFADNTVKCEWDKNVPNKKEDKYPCLKFLR